MPGPFMRKIHGMKITDPAFNYDLLGQNYSSIRQTDTRIAALTCRPVICFGFSVCLVSGKRMGAYHLDRRPDELINVF